MKGVDVERGEQELRRTVAIIDSMTPRERADPSVMNGSRRKRIARGSVTGLAHPTAADLTVQAEGPTLAEWYAIAGVGLPHTPPYRTQGRVKLDAGTWVYEDFTGRMGRSDLAR